MAHHVTAARLSVLQRAAYQQYFDTHLANDALPTFREWCKTHSEVHPQFLTHDNLTRAPSHAVCEISERRQLPAVCKNAWKVGPVVIWHGSYALLEVGVSPYQRHDPAEGHTSETWPGWRTHIRDMTRLKDTHQRHDPAEGHISETWPGWRTHIQVFTASSHKVTSRCKRQDTPSHLWHWIKTTNSWMREMEGPWDWPKIQLRYSGGWLQDLK